MPVNPVRTIRTHARSLTSRSVCILSPCELSFRRILYQTTSQTATITDCSTGVDTFEIMRIWRHGHRLCNLTRRPPMRTASLSKTAASRKNPRVAPPSCRRRAKRAGGTPRAQANCYLRRAKSRPLSWRRSDGWPSARPKALRRVCDGYYSIIYGVAQ